MLTFLLCKKFGKKISKQTPKNGPKRIINIFENGDTQNEMTIQLSSTKIPIKTQLNIAFFLLSRVESVPTALDGRL